MKLKFFSLPTPIGIDVHAEEIRLVQLKKIQRGYEVINMDYKKLPAETFAEGKIKCWDNVCSTLSQLVHTLGLENQFAAISLPASLVRMQRMSLPTGLTAAEIEAEIFTYLQLDLPNSQEELFIDFTELPASESAYADIFFAAARQEYLSHYIACLKEAKLEVKIVDVDIYALKRALLFCLKEHSDPLELMALLYLTSNSATLLVGNKDIILWHQFWGQAQINDFYMQLKNGLQINLNQNKAIKKIIICGTEKLDRTKISPIVSEINYLNPFDYLKLSAKVQLNPSLCAPKFLIACGLAMRELPRW